MQMSRVSEKWSDQYGIPCIAVESPDFVNVDALIARCEEIGAVRKVDGIEFCVELRDEVGPELWTEDSLRRSTGKGLVAEAGAENVRTQAEKDAAELTYTIRVSRYFRRD